MNTSLGYRDRVEALLLSLIDWVRLVIPERDSAHRHLLRHQLALDDRTASPDLVASVIRKGQHLHVLVAVALLAAAAVLLPVSVLLWPSSPRPQQLTRSGGRTRRHGAFDVPFYLGWGCYGVGAFRLMDVSAGPVVLLSVLALVPGLLAAYVKRRTH